MVMREKAAWQGCGEDVMEWGDSAALCGPGAGVPEAWAEGANGASPR